MSIAFGELSSSELDDSPNILTSFLPAFFFNAMEFIKYNTNLKSLAEVTEVAMLLTNRLNVRKLW